MVSVFSPLLQSTVSNLQYVQQVLLLFFFFFPKLFGFLEDKEGPTYGRTLELVPSVYIFSWKAEELNENMLASNEEGQIPT